MSTCILISSCQKSDLNENKDFLKNKANKGDGIGTKKKNLAIGDYYGGGIVYYLDETGQHGLIVATEDAGSGKWGCYGTFIPGTTFHFGTGQENTNAIISNCNEPGIAARICDSWVSRDKGDKGKKYYDWFLPSLFEMNRIGDMQSILNNSELGNFILDEMYWTSTQGTKFMASDPDGATQAFMVKFVQFEDLPYQEVLITDKNVEARVRPIRAF